MTTENYDPFAVGGDHSDSGDARVLALFHDWLDACREADRRCDDADQTEYEATVERMGDIEDQISATAGGPVALAVKTYLWHRADLSHWAPDGAVVRFPELFERDCEAHDLLVSIFRDAAKQVPEIAELAAPIIHEDARLIDAEIDVQWCQEIGLRSDDSGFREDAAEQLAGALDRIDRITAKTARGETIKARHAGVMKQERQKKSELRGRAEALAAEYSAPLPDGDAGLIEAERRLKEIRQRSRALYRDFFKINVQTEQDIIIAIIDPVRYGLSDFIDQTRPVGLAGAAVKLRLLADEEIGMAAGENQDELASLRQVLEFVEREAQP